MKFRKKPVVVEAMQFHGRLDRDPDLAAFVRDYRGPHDKEIRLNQRSELEIPTLEGVMFASNGDWIIKGVDGEFYPCKPSIFAKTYELIECDCPLKSEKEDEAMIEKRPHPIPVLYGHIGLYEHEWRNLMNVHEEMRIWYDEMNKTTTMGMYEQRFMLCTMNMAEALSKIAKSVLTEHGKEMA